MHLKQVKEEKKEKKRKERVKIACGTYEISSSEPKHTL